MKLYTMGYGKWVTKNRLMRIVNALKSAKVRVVIDIRISPCSSSLSLKSNYGPKPWNLQAGNNGIAHLLESNSIKYIWLVELGNPQKNDPNQSVLKEHIATKDEKWPVNRGLAILSRIIGEGELCCILCACKDYNKCHRKTIAEAVNSRFFNSRLSIIDLDGFEVL